MKQKPGGGGGGGVEARDFTMSEGHGPGPTPPTVVTEPGVRELCVFGRGGQRW